MHKIRTLTGIKNGWTLPALGLSLFFFVISESCTYGNVWYQLTVSFSLPFIFFLNGYTIKLPRNIREFRNKIIYDFLFLLLAPIAAYIIRSLVAFLINTDVQHTQIALLNMLRITRESLLAATGTETGITETIPSIGLIWILFSLFFERCLVSFIHIIFCHFYSRAGKRPRLSDLSSRGEGNPNNESNFINKSDRKKLSEKFFLLENIILVLLAVLGIVFNSLTVFLPINLNVTLGCLLFYCCGRLYKHFQYVFDKNYIYFIVLSASGIGTVFSQIRGTYLNLNASHVFWPILSIFGTISSCFLLAFVYRQVFRLKALKRFWALWGERFIPILLLSPFDTLIRQIWDTKIIWLNSILRPFNLFAVTLIVFALLQRIGLVNNRKAISFYNTYRKGINLIFYILLVFGLFSYSGWTLLTTELWKNITRQLKPITDFGFFTIWAMSVSNIDSLWQFVLQFLMFVGGGLNYINGGDTRVLSSILVILASMKKSYQKISFIAILEILILGIATYFCSVNGIVLYEVRSGGTLGLHSFGFSHPNIFGWWLMMLCMLYISLHKKVRFQTLLIDCPIVMFCAFLNYRYADSITSLACTLLVLIMWVLFQFFSFISKYFNILDTIGRNIIKITGIVIYPILFLLSILIPISYYYRGGNFWGKTLLSKITDPTTFGNRMAISFNALYNIPIKLFGNNYQESTEGTYFIVDSSYIRLILNYGIIICSIFMIVIVWTSYKCAKFKRYDLILLLIAEAFYGFSEGNILWFAFDPLLLISFASINNDDKGTYN